MSTSRRRLGSVPHDVPLVPAAAGPACRLLPVERIAADASVGAGHQDVTAGSAGRRTLGSGPAPRR
ncbi:hypothetical protein [Streptomyces sp. CRN 30]|uniref:hypothetical protein n=1 Tax=Streptomyces sp. CRN 30 TaxID=3075613 RepID=UPI002A8001DB|nr:hypothetical protein [Streptomyces sp. CRN 30]